MFLEFIRGIFSIANTFIAFFIVIYAYFFLKKTKSHKERRPWDYLFIASIVYAIFTLFSMLLAIYGVNMLLSIHLSEVNIFFQFVYTGLILLCFISQTDLIFKNELIIITRKLDPGEEKNIDVKIIQDKGEERIELDETKHEILENTIDELKKIDKKEGTEFKKIKKQVSAPKKKQTKKKPVKSVKKKSVKKKKHSVKQKKKK